MTVDVQKALEEFHSTFDHYMGGAPAVPPPEDGERTKELRKRLIREEFQELIDAIDADDLVGIADGVADLVYVAVGTDVSYGIPFNLTFREVHRSNMDKLVDGQHYRDDAGKTIKPPGWQPPNIEGILRAAS